MRDFIEIVETIHRSVAFADHMTEACDRARAGSYFEDGGSFGMALALYDKMRDLGLAMELVMDDRQHHAMVKVGDHLFDHEGEGPVCEGLHTYTPDEFLKEAMKYWPENRIAADKAFANEIIRDACELAKSPKS